MPLQHVRQIHSNGCFIACVAMLLGKSYAEAFALMYPGKDLNDWDIQGLTSTDIGKAASELLEKFGCAVKKSTYKRIKSLQKFSRKSALLIIRWRWGAPTSGHVSEDDPWMCHAVVFDADTKKFLDPSGYCPRDMKDYQKQLDSVFYVEPPRAA